MKPSIKFALGAAAGAALAALLVFGRSGQTEAPQVQYTSLKGEQTTQAALKGKVVLVNFWYPRCVGCVSETPKLIDTYKKFQGRDFATVGVAMNIDPPQIVSTFVEQFQVPYFIAFDSDGSIAKQFGDVQLAPRPS